MKFIGLKLVELVLDVDIYICIEHGFVVHEDHLLTCEEHFVRQSNSPGCATRQWLPGGYVQCWSNQDQTTKGLAVVNTKKLRCFLKVIQYMYMWPFKTPSLYCIVCNKNAFL